MGIKYIRFVIKYTICKGIVSYSASRLCTSTGFGRHMQQFIFHAIQSGKEYEHSHSFLIYKYSNAICKFILDKATKGYLLRFRTKSLPIYISSDKLIWTWIIRTHAHRFHSSFKTIQR